MTEYTDIEPQEDLAWIACSAALELELMMAGRRSQGNAVQSLCANIPQIMEDTCKVPESPRPLSESRFLYDSAAELLADSVMDITDSLDNGSAGKFGERIAKAQVLVQDLRRASTDSDLMQLEELRDFCLALAKRASMDDEVEYDPTLDDI